MQSGRVASVVARGNDVIAKYDPKETTKAARAAFATRFEREVDPDGTLPEVERLRRAESARKAYFSRLAYLSAKARTKRARGGKA